MVKQSDDELLIEAFNKLREQRRKAQQKQEEKLWAGIAAPLSLPDALERLTKEELTAITGNLEIRGLSKYNKQQLAEKLSETVPEAVKRTLLNFDQHRYATVKAVASKGGVAAVPALEAEQFEYYRERGILFTGTDNGKKIFVMPQEIMESFQEADNTSLQSILRKNTELVQLTLGMLHYYGTLSFETVQKKLSEYMRDEADFITLLPLLEEAEHYYRAHRMGNGFLSAIRVLDEKEVRKEHDMRPGVDYYPFSKKDLLKAGQPPFVDRNPGYKAMVRYIRENYEISDEEADNLVEECVYAINIGDSLADMLEFLQSQLEIETEELLNGFMDRLVELHNHTRQWFLKGYSPAELSALSGKRAQPQKQADVISINTKKKIGRNDPCPCGSGKKFKKCCGSAI